MYTLRVDKKIVTQKTARRFLIAWHGLDRYAAGSKENAILDYFGKVGSIQFDPLDICGKNAELVLQSRVRNFKPRDLYNLLYKKRELTEGWDKMMCIYNMYDYPYFQRRRDRDLQFYQSDRCKEIRQLEGPIKEIIRKNGPVSSLDLDIEGKVDWAWAPAKLSKAALEILFYSGHLGIDSRIQTRRVYDLVENLVPSSYLKGPNPLESDEAYIKWRVLRRIRGLGLYYGKSGDGWLGMARKKDRDPALEQLVHEGDLIPVEVEDMPWPFYIPREGEDLLRSIEKGERKISRNIRFLAPLDNFMWDRFLIEQFFGFQYRWEVYKPEDDREYGYYVLPVLYGDKIVARFEPVRNKKEKVLTIKGWWWEKGIKQTEKLRRSVEKSLISYARFLDSSLDLESVLNLIFND